MGAPMDDHEIAPANMHSAARRNYLEFGAELNANKIRLSCNRFRSRTSNADDLARLPREAAILKALQAVGRGYSSQDRKQSGDLDAEEAYCAAVPLSIASVSAGKFTFTCPLMERAIAAIPTCPVFPKATTCIMASSMAAGNLN